MNDADLKSRLKNVPVPERTEEYWDDFPARVRGRLRRPAPAAQLNENWRPQFAWKFAVATACLIFVLFVFNQPLKVASAVIFHQEKAMRHQLAELNQHLRVFMADDHGMYYLVADKE
jgi:hypothetical protein